MPMPELFSAGRSSVKGRRLAAHRDPDDVVPRRAAEIGVRRQREAEPHRPVLARPHPRQEAVDVENHRRRRVARQDPLEMLARQRVGAAQPGQRVAALEEERAAQLEAHPHQVGAFHQHPVERRDRLVEQRVPPVLRNARKLRRPDRREAEIEQRVRVHAVALDERPQHRQRLVVAAQAHQGARLRHLRHPSRLRGRGRDYRRRHGARSRGGPGGRHQDQDGRQDAEGGRATHRLSFQPMKQRLKKEGGPKAALIGTVFDRYLRAPNAPT